MVIPERELFAAGLLAMLLVLAQPQMDGSNLKREPLPVRGREPAEEVVQGQPRV
jgi:hypothetical protein